MHIINVKNDLLVWKLVVKILIVHLLGRPFHHLSSVRAIEIVL